MATSNFITRVWMSLVVTLATLTTLYFSHTSYFRTVFIAVVSLIALLGLKEMFRMASLKGFKPQEGISYVFLAALMLSVFLSREEPSLSFLPESIGLLFFMSLFLYQLLRGNEPFLNISITLFCFLYIAIPLGALIKINYFPSTDGRIWLFYLLTIVKSTDIGAYFFGKRFGKTRLAPYISPQKTWEGTVGGFLFAFLASILFLLFIPFLSQVTGLLLAFFMSFFAQFGDLAESLLKRDAKVKDSSHLPGLGGILDILDSLVFALPLLYILLQSNIL